MRYFKFLSCFLLIILFLSCTENPENDLLPDQESPTDTEEPDPKPEPEPEPEDQLKPYAEWKFDDPSDLTKASMGTDLILSGTHKVIDGPTDYDGAARIGLGSHYTFTHNLQPISGEKFINRYSILFDLRVPALSGFNSIFQANSDNTDDGEIFITEWGIGRGNTGYSTTKIEAGKWYRLIMVIDGNKEYSLYLDGKKILDGEKQAIDGDFGLRSSIYFFRDNDGEERDIDIARISFYNCALQQEDISKIGNLDIAIKPEILTKPYLQNVSKTGITIMWESNVNNKGIVNYSTDKSNLEFMSESVTKETNAKTYVHKARLDNLKPGTMYYYQVINHDFTSSINSFITAPKEDNTTFTVGIWGDSHQESPWKYMADYMVDKLNVDFAFSTGDLSNSGNKREDLSTVFLPHVCERIGSKIPFFVSLGNHDVGESWEGGDLIRQYLDCPVEVNSDPNAFNGSYLLIYGNVAFISIDWNKMETQVFPDYWLENTLKREDVQKARFRFIFIHNAPFYERWQVAEKERIKEYLPPLAEKYNVDAVFSGHMHGYERGILNGVNYITQGGGGKYMDTTEKVGPTIYEHIIIGTDKKDNPQNFNNGLTFHILTLHIEGEEANAKLHYFDENGNYLGVIETYSVKRQSGN